jgi:hypothetical protein
VRPPLRALHIIIQCATRQSWVRRHAGVCAISNKRPQEWSGGTYTRNSSSCAVFAAIHDNRDAMDAFARMNAGTVSPARAGRLCKDHQRRLREMGKVVALLATSKGLRHSKLFAAFPNSWPLPGNRLPHSDRGLFQGCFRNSRRHASVPPSSRFEHRVIAAEHYAVLQSPGDLTLQMRSFRSSSSVWKT